MRKEILCPAKINLHLIIGPRDLARPGQTYSKTIQKTDAYHRICTLLQALYLYKGTERSTNNIGGDVLELELKSTTAPNKNMDNLQNRLHLDCHPAPPCAEHENLVYRAAKSYLQFYGQYYPKKKNWPEQLQFRLKKQIPQQAGLGGGSSNAAAALKLLNQMLPTYCRSPALNQQKLSQIAAGLGSDIAFFLQDSVTLKPNKIGIDQMGSSQKPSLAWGLERGQKIVPLSRPLTLQRWQSRHQLWIVKPKNVFCPTAAMYRLLDKGLTKFISSAYHQRLEAEIAKWPEHNFCQKLRSVLQNDFLIAIQDYVRENQDAESLNLPSFSVLVTLWQYLYSLRASWVSLCGSGAAMFAWFPAQMEKSQILRSLLDFPNELDIFMAHPF